VADLPGAGDIGAVATGELPEMEPDAGVNAALGVFPETCPLQELSKRSAAAVVGTIRRDE